MRLMKGFEDEEKAYVGRGRAVKTKLARQCGGVVRP
jgi:hypothetical protein